MKIRILSWNANRSNALRNDFHIDIAYLNYDIICFQEISLRALDVIKGSFSNYSLYLSKEVIYFRKKTKIVYLVTLVSKRLDENKITVSEFNIGSLDTDKSRLYQAINRSIEIEYSYLDLMVNSKCLRIFNCHLQYATSPTKRLAQLSQILSSANDACCNILCGDLNTISNRYTSRILGPIMGYEREDYDIDERRQVKKMFSEYVNPHEYSKTTIFGNGQLDYILVPTSIRVSRMGIINKYRHRSDHHPICVEVDLSD